MFAVLVVGFILSAGVASAYRGDYSVQGPDFNDERHTAMEQAFDSLNYNAWRSFMTESGRNPRVVEVVTESNFKTFVEAHEAGQAGNHELAASLRAELGLNNGNGPKNGSGHKGQGRMQRNRNR